MLPARPTLRALREDLKQVVPPVDEPLDKIEHPLLAKAREQFAEDDASHELIRAIDDQVFYKVKVQRWRGAVWTDEQFPWVVAAGSRESGSEDDFYKALETRRPEPARNTTERMPRPCPATPTSLTCCRPTSTGAATAWRPVPGSERT